MTILKVKTNVTSYELAEFLKKHYIVEGMKFGISWKVKKRRKLRTYKVLHFEFPNENGSVSITIGKGTQRHVMNEFHHGYLAMTHFV